MMDMLVQPRKTKEISKIERKRIKKSRNNRRLSPQRQSNTHHLRSRQRRMHQRTLEILGLGNDPNVETKQEVARSRGV